MSTRNLPMCHGRYSMVNTGALWNELTKYYEEQLAAEEEEEAQHMAAAAAAAAAVAPAEKDVHVHAGEQPVEDQVEFEATATSTTMLDHGDDDGGVSHHINKKAFVENLSLLVDVKNSPTPVSSPSIESNYMTYLPRIAEETDEDTDVDVESSPSHSSADELQVSDATQDESDEQTFQSSPLNEVYTLPDTVSIHDAHDATTSTVTSTDVPCYVDIPVYLSRQQHDDTMREIHSSITISIPYIEPKYTQVSSMARYRSPSPFSLDDPNPYHQQQYQKQDKEQNYADEQLKQQRLLYSSIVKKDRSADSYNLHSIWHAFSQIIFFLQLLHPTTDVIHANHDHEQRQEESATLDQSHRKSVALPSEAVAVGDGDGDPVPEDAPPSQLFKEVIETVQTLEQSSEEVSITLFVSVLQQVFHLLHVDLQKAAHSQLNEEATPQTEYNTPETGHPVHGHTGDRLQHEEDQTQLLIKNKKTTSFICTLPSI